MANTYTELHYYCIGNITAHKPLNMNSRPFWKGTVWNMMRDIYSVSAIMSGRYATRLSLFAHRGLKPTANMRNRYAANQTAEVIGTRQRPYSSTHYPTGRRPMNPLMKTTKNRRWPCRVATVH
jgi:hypothetical protein